MSTVFVSQERRNYSIQPGKTMYWPDPLNQGDSIDIVLDWTGWVGSETVSSAAWSANSGITVSGTSVSSNTTLATITAGSSTEGEVIVECAMTTSGAQIRSVAIVFEIVNLR